ncbi:hypothetical protein MJD09_27305 [bacterium]|nr:hypothetical protein [bacterium]
MGKISQQEQRLFTKLISGKKPAEAENYLVNKLLKESYLIEKDGYRIHLFSSTFADCLRDHLGVRKGWGRLRFWS